MVAVSVVRPTVSAAITGGRGRVVVIRFREVLAAVLGRVVHVMVVMRVRCGGGRFALGGIAAAVVVGGDGCGGGGCGVLMLRLQVSVGGELVHGGGATGK